MSIHDIVQPLSHDDIRTGRQVRLAPGAVAVVFTPTQHGLVAQSIVAHPETVSGADAQSLGLLLTWAMTVPDLRERLNRRLQEIAGE